MHMGLQPENLLICGCIVFSSAAVAFAVAGKKERMGFRQTMFHAYLRYGL